jgi:hypothetical protein
MQGGAADVLGALLGFIRFAITQRSGHRLIGSQRARRHLHVDIASNRWIVLGRSGPVLDNSEHQLSRSRSTGEGALCLRMKAAVWCCLVLFGVTRAIIALLLAATSVVGVDRRESGGRECI